MLCGGVNIRLITGKSSRHQLADESSVDADSYFNGTDTWTNITGSAASIVFQGVEFILYSTLSPQGGQMSILLDYNSTTISTLSNETLVGQAVYMMTDLDPSTLHAVTIRMLGGTCIDIDKVGITPPPPSAFPPAMPQNLPPGKSTSQRLLFKTFMCLLLLGKTSISKYDPFFPPQLMQDSIC